MSGPSSDLKGLEAPPELKVSGLVVRFGGLAALDDVSFIVHPGTVHALIGPNGAGKSTCFNVVSGLYEVENGEVRFGPHDILGRPPHGRVSCGIGRAFQNTALSGHVTVLDNVMLGRHALTRGGFLRAGLRSPRMRGEQRRHEDRARAICNFLDLSGHLDRPVSQLSYGDQKRVDVARALATEPTLLMLDEPAAGMNDVETATMAETISSIRSDLGISVLLIEHDMSLVMGIADRVTVLDFGRVIADGTPDEVRRMPEVIRAYLGSTSDEALPKGSAR